MSRLWLSQILPEQVTPTSCWWVQLCFPHPSCLQSQRADSFPRQETWSIQMRPEPTLELAHPVALIAVGHPSCLQITETSSMPQPLLHTVPHSSWTFTSTLPAHLSSPSVSLSSFSAPPATMQKGSDCLGSKERVENYYSLDYLFIFQSQIWETFQTHPLYNRRMLFHGNATTYISITGFRWSKDIKPVKLSNTIVRFFIMSIYIISTENLLCK